MIREPKTEEMESLLSQREVTHGSFREVALAYEELKSILRSSELPATCTMALDMICMKLARIRYGDPIEPDHWRDIAGYATLALRELTKKGE